MFRSQRSKEPKLRHEDNSQNGDRELMSEVVKFPTAKGLIAQSRFMKSAMSEQLCDFDVKNPNKSGIPSKELIEIYKKWGDGKFGIIITGAAMINGKEIEIPGNVIVDKNVLDDKRKSAFKKWIDETKKNGSLFILQTFHPGSASSDWTKSEKIDLGAMSQEELEKFLDQYVDAALFAESIGFDGVEIPCAYHFALGYLIAQNMNKREDDYGGNLEHRSRAIFKIINDIRGQVKDNSKFLIGVKLCSYNHMADFNEDEFGSFLQKLEESGVDYVTLTGGHYGLLKEMTIEEEEQMSGSDGTFRKMAKAAKENLLNTKVYLNGGFVTLGDMADAVHKGWSAGVSLGRPVCAEPDLPKKILAGQVSSAIKSLVNPTDFPTSQQIAGIQMWQHATKNSIMDSSNEDHFKKFKKILDEHQNSVKNAKDKPLIGYPHLIV